MPNPKIEVGESTPALKEKEANENEFLKFLETPVQAFEAPELPIEEEENLEDDENSLYFDKDDEPINPKSEKESLRMASRYVKLFDKAFSGLAAAYSSGDVDDYKITQGDQDDLADPLAELIAEKKLLDLPPGWALAITALIIYAPLTIKAVKEHKDYKVIEKTKAEKPENKTIEDKEDKEDS